MNNEKKTVNDDRPSDDVGFITDPPKLVRNYGRDRYDDRRTDPIGQFTRDLSKNLPNKYQKFPNYANI